MTAGFSADGYIVDQNHMGAYRYRGMSSDINGCGWIAAYNLLHALGFEINHEQVFAQMNAMFPLKIPGPTPNRVLYRTLRRYIRFELLRGRRRARACEKSRAGILRYWEGPGPHFVTFVRQADGRFRFLNVADGLEDCQFSMPAFFETRCKSRFVRALVVIF